MMTVCDIRYKPFSDFHYEARGNYQCYNYRIALPWTYTDKLMRISVYAWLHDDKWVWRFSIAASGNPKVTFNTKEEAAAAAVEAVKQLIAVAQTIKVENILQTQQDPVL